MLEDPESNVEKVTRVILCITRYNRADDFFGGRIDSSKLGLNMTTQRDQIRDVQYFLRRVLNRRNELIIDEESSWDRNLLVGSGDRDGSDVCHSGGKEATIGFIRLRTKEASAQLHSHRHHRHLLVITSANASPSKSHVLLSIPREIDSLFTQQFPIPFIYLGC